MSKRPPIAPTQSFNEEEGDTVPELGEAQLPLKASLNYSPLDPAEYIDRTEWLQDTPIYITGDSGPVLLCLHGAGHSGLSFACLGKLVKSWGTLVAFDFRAHGAHRGQATAYQLDADTLINDTLEVLQWVREHFTGRAIVLVGHSMGGAIAAKAARVDQSQGNSVSGVLMLDVVEGSALEALPHMDAVISKRPQHFKSCAAAVHWAVASGYIKSLESARVSLPTQVKEFQEKWVFVTDLARTRTFWPGWFSGMNDAFLAVDAAKQLIIAGSDRTDRQMMIAQMQGKFKHTVFSTVGHVIQEDDPGRLCAELHSFVNTFRLNS